MRVGRNMMRRGWGEECDDEDGRGIPMTPVSMRICMQTIYEEEKIIGICDDQSPESKQPEVYSCVVLYDHQACSFVRTYERAGSRR